MYFSDEPIPTLIDAPPDGERFLEELENGLRVLGYSVGDIRRIVVTHPHFDHYGSAATIKELSGAEVWASKNGAEWIENYERVILDQEKYRTMLLEKNGVPIAEIQYIKDYYRKTNRFAHRALISMHVEDGDRFDFAEHSFVACNVPGHTPGCVLFHNAEKGIAFTGDFLADDIYSNPLVQWPDLTISTYNTLGSYLESLKRVREMKLRICHPGHGEIIENPEKRILEILDAIIARRMAILQILEKGNRTALEIMDTLFPGLAREHLFRGISDTIGHLEMLEKNGLVERTIDYPIRFHVVHSVHRRQILRNHLRKSKGNSKE